ncbi:TPA: LysR substrate-binding domain-containing protein [Citrobacter freundii]
MDKIYAMQLFIHVAEMESFSRVAETFAIPKGSVSRQIQALEKQLGTQLLHRTTRRVQLTADGTAYYARAKDLLSNLTELDGMFHHGTASISGKLRVDIPAGLATSLVIPHLPAFLQQNPGIELEISSSGRPVDLVREDFDCVMRTGAINDTTLIARPLGKLTVINCASPHYLTRFGYPESPDDLASHALVHYAARSDTRGFVVASEDGEQWIKTGSALTVNSSETWLAACHAGLGIIQTPRVTVHDALRSGALVEVLPQYRAAPLPVILLYPPRRNLSRRVHLFIEWLSGIMEKYVDRDSRRFPGA